MGTKKIVLGEHVVEIPTPVKRSEIYLLDEKDPTWRRIELPQIFHQYIAKHRAKNGVYTKLNSEFTEYDQDNNLIGLSEQDTALLIRTLKEEIHRRTYGLHCKIGKEIVWICPDYYHVLQNCQMKDLSTRYGGFRWVQNDALIMWWHVKRMENMAGVIFPKCKKSGLTQIISGAFLNESTLVSGFEFGAASKEYDHVKNVFMAYYFHSFDTMPDILKPDVAKRNLSEIIFNRPAPKAGGKASADYGLALNTRMNGYKSKSNCFDGPVLKRGFIDEGPKWWESSSIHPDHVFSKNIEAVKLQQKINGKLCFASYMPEVDDAGFIEFKDWCNKSLLRTKDPSTGRTESNLVVFPIYAHESNEECFDRYGRCDKKKAFALVSQERDSKTKLADKLAHMRQYPLTWSDMFDIGGQGVVFDNLRLGMRHRDLEDGISAGAYPFKFMKLHWARDWDGKRQKRPAGEFSSVRAEYFDPAKVKAEGLQIPFWLFDDIPQHFLNQVIERNSTDDDGMYCPVLGEDVPVGVISFDPVDYVLKKDVIDGSTNAGQAGYIYSSELDNKMGRIFSNIPLMEYYMREEDPDDDYENLVRWIIYTGMFVICESNKTWVLKKLQDDKLNNFIIIRDDKGIYRPMAKTDQRSTASATQATINDYCRLLNKWMAPKKAASDIDYMDYLKSTRTIADLMKFNPTETKRFDLSVSIGWWRIGMEAISEWAIKNEHYYKQYSKESLGAAWDGVMGL